MFNGKKHKIECDKCDNGHIILTTPNEDLMLKYYHIGQTEGVIPPCPPGVTQLAHMQNVIHYYPYINFNLFETYKCPLADKCEEGRIKEV